jgi:DNA-binding HxlR family transcriptional regulator
MLDQVNVDEHPALANLRPRNFPSAFLIGRMLPRVTDKRTVLVVRVLGRGPSRFYALRREVGEISQKVLASTLMNLEENGFVSRTVAPLSHLRSSMR